MIERRQRPWHLYGLALIAVAVAVVAIAQIGPPSSSARTSRQVVTAARGVVQSTVSGSGNVAAGTDVNANFQTSGTLSHVYVTVGQHVIKGELLATLDPTSAQLTLNQAEKTLTSAEDQLTAAENGSSSSSSSTGSSSSATGASLTVGSSSSEFVSYTSMNRRNNAATTTTPATTPSTTTTTTPTTTTTTPTTPPTTPSTTTTSSTPTTPSATQSPSSAPATGAAGGGSGAGSAGGSTSTTSSAASIASAQASVYSAEASVQSAKTALEHTQLHAPVSGTIVSLSSLQPGDSVSAGSTSSNTSSSSSSNSASAGGTGTSAGSLGGSGSSSASSASSASSSSFAEIVNTSTMTMTVAFSESDIPKVKVGQPATVTLDALSGVQLGAHVTAISSVGTTSSSVVSYDATLTLDQNDSRVKPGMSASASVIVGQAQGVTVPNDAVSGSGSLATVNVSRGGKTVSQQVVVGLKGDSRTQIVSGLRAGDQLVVTTTLPSLGSSSSGSSSSGSNGTLGGAGSLGGGGFPGSGGGFPGGGPPGGG